MGSFSGSFGSERSDKHGRRNDASRPHQSTEQLNPFDLSFIAIYFVICAFMLDAPAVHPRDTSFLTQGRPKPHYKLGTRAWLLDARPRIS
jgi:hypothetical protein